MSCPMTEAEAFYLKVLIDSALAADCTISVSSPWVTPMLKYSRDPVSIFNALGHGVEDTLGIHRKRQVIGRLFVSYTHSGAPDLFKVEYPAPPDYSGSVLEMIIISANVQCSKARPDLFPRAASLPS